MSNVYVISARTKTLSHHWNCHCESLCVCSSHSTRPKVWCVCECRRKCRGHCYFSYGHRRTRGNKALSQRTCLLRLHSGGVRRKSYRNRTEIICSVDKKIDNKKGKKKKHRRFATAGEVKGAGWVKGTPVEKGRVPIKQSWERHWFIRTSLPPGLLSWKIKQLRNHWINRESKKGELDKYTAITEKEAKRK